MIIYCITNNINGKKYIGKSVVSFKKRWSQHLSCKHKDHFHDAIRKYNKDVWTFTTLEILDSSESVDLLNVLERYWIDHYDTFRNGYNETKGGDGFTGKHTPESKEKISEANKGGKNPFFGKTHSEENLGKMRQPRGNTDKMKQPKSKTAKENMRLAKIGTKISEETKERMREAQRRRWKERKQLINVENRI